MAAGDVIELLRERVRPERLRERANGLQVLTRRRGHAVTLTVYGELTLPDGAQLGGAVAAAIQDGPAVLVIDLTPTSLVDSAGLAVLLEAKRRAVRSGTVLRVVCEVPDIVHLLHLSRLERDFDLYPSVRAALAA
jgi:anti-sigma B factor antagonist